MIHAAIALVADVIAMALLLVFTNLGVYTIVIAQIVYAVVMCLLNDRSSRNIWAIRIRGEVLILSPFLASIPMGVVAEWCITDCMTDPFQCESVLVFP